MAAPIFTTSRIVEFRDTDAAGIVHFSVFLQYMEQAEHEFLRKRGLSVMGSDEHGTLAWPRVAVNCDYRGSARFEDTVEIELSVDRLGDKSIRYRFVFRVAGVEIATGTMTTVCCREDGQGGYQSTAIPEWFRNKLNASPRP
ncbi:MAG TPA: acyl-CoA thioesterase [Pirellulales bacterium]|nr:acyl-CoA thioesterase [Pirellulales bacterium]